jgi:hypothetical protein
MAASGSAFMRVRIQNLSAQTWPVMGTAEGRHPLMLGNHWLDEGGRCLLADDGRAALPADVPPLEEVELELVIQTLPAPNRYILELDMVHEGVVWFANKGSQTTRLDVLLSEGHAHGASGDRGATGAATVSPGPGEEDTTGAVAAEPCDALREMTA